MAPGENKNVEWETPYSLHFLSYLSYFPILILILCQLGMPYHKL